MKQPEKMMTEHDRLRLENINKGNDDGMLAARSSEKRQSAQTKSSNQSPVVKKPKTEAPCRSLRSLGKPPPDVSIASGVNVDINDKKKQIKKMSKLSSFSISKKNPRLQGSFQMRNAYGKNDGSDRELVETISRSSMKSQMSDRDTDSSYSSKKFGLLETRRKRVLGSVDVKALQLDPDNIARVVSERILNLCFFPTMDMEMVVVGNKHGNLGFWNVGARKNDGNNGIYVYHPHPGPISGIVVDLFSISKMYSSCYNGFVRLMDVEKEVFDMVYYNSEDSIYSISTSPHDTKSLCMSEGEGGFNIWDMRAGKSSLSCNLHEDRINTLDCSINSGNDNIIATSSTDGTACIWDLRLLTVDKPESLKTVRHQKAVHSAYFSPSEKFLATTSADDKISISTVADYEETSMIYHNNKTSRWILKFRGVWGWNDESVFIGNYMNKGVDVISIVMGNNEKIVGVDTLESDLISAIPCRFNTHPYKLGVLAGATSGGQVYIWRTTS